MTEVQPLTDEEIAEIEASFHNGIDLNDLISYALRRATNPGA
jgi:hypothetical protein